MSEYFLADKRAQERAKQRAGQKGSSTSDSQNVKVTLLGDFLLPTAETQGCDPYNSSHGKNPQDAWIVRKPR